MWPAANNFWFALVKSKEHLFARKSHRANQLSRIIKSSLRNYFLGLILDPGLAWSLFGLIEDPGLAWSAFLGLIDDPGFDLSLALMWLSLLN
jgi:hypothetical protein